MSISCDYGDPDGCEWWWELSDQEIRLSTKRSRKCCSCGETIKVGETARRVERRRAPNNDIEERIHGDEVNMSNWYLCEKCSDLAFNLSELGLCYSLGDESIQDQIIAYNESKATP